MIAQLSQSSWNFLISIYLSATGYFILEMLQSPPLRIMALTKYFNNNCITSFKSLQHTGIKSQYFETFKTIEQPLHVELLRNFFAHVGKRDSNWSRAKKFYPLNKIIYFTFNSCSQSFL